MKKNTARSACTAMLVGKKASMDGSVIIARNEDFYTELCPKVFVVEPAVNQADRIYRSANTGVKIPLPQKAYRYTSTPEANAHAKNSEGVYGEAGINEKGVAMSATESLYGNERVLAYDPLVPNGIAEDALQDIVLPYINSAKEGVEYLGRLIAKYGSAEGNGVLFADRNEAWYMEIPCGHQWVAQRIPDDCYAFAPNQVSIETIDFSKPADFLWSTGIQDFVKKHNLNPDRAGFNFRHIFGTSSEQDRIYNTPRAWFAQKYLNPEIEQSPTSNTIPFIQKANRLIAIEDVQYILRSHYNETAFDPIGRGSNEADKKRFRSISLSRTAESHILQLRPNLPLEQAGLHWLAFGTNAFVPYTPFFTAIENTPSAYRKMTKDVSITNAYWLFKLIGHFVEGHYHTFKAENDAYLLRIQSYCRRRIAEIDEMARDKKDEALIRFLTEENKKTADFILNDAKKYLSDLMKQSFRYSKLIFTMDSHL